MSTTVPLSAETFNLFPAATTNHVINFTRMPYTSFLIQEVSLPGVSATSAKFNAPGLAVHHIADRLIYEPLTITFMVDEGLKAHRELHSWLIGVTGGEDRSVLTKKFIDDQWQFSWLDPKSSQQLNAVGSTIAGLTIVNPARQPILRFMFYNVHITQLGGVQFSTTAYDTISAMTSTATFEYDYYSIVEI